MTLFNVLILSFVILFNLLSGMKIYVKPEGPTYEIRIFCGKNREKLVTEFEQSGVQNIVEKWDAKFLQFDPKDLELAKCVDEVENLIIDALSPSKIQMTVCTTVGQMSNEQTLVIGIPEHVFTAKTFTMIEKHKAAEKVTIESKNTEEDVPNLELNKERVQPSGSTSSGLSRISEYLDVGEPYSDAKEWTQLVVYCWKENIDSVTTHQREERSQSLVILGASWGQNNRVSIYRNENGESELKECTRDGIVLDWGKTRILMPQSRFLEVDEFMSISSDQKMNSDQLIKTTFTFDNKLNSWDHDLVYRVLVYCYKKGSERKAMLLFGFGNQSIFNSYKATVSMVPDRQTIMDAYCEGGKFLVDVWRWNTVYSTFEFAELKAEEHLPVENQWKSKLNN